MTDEGEDLQALFTYIMKMESLRQGKFKRRYPVLLVEVAS